MKLILFISCFLLISTAQSHGQVDCDDYNIVSIFDIPPTPQTPGGNYFLLLLSLDEDNLNNIDNYANLFFIDNAGDTISIPTGTNSTLPRFSSDTIPYILKINSPNSNQDFPDEFDGKLVIIHSTQLVCEVDYSNISTSIYNNQGKFDTHVYPNPFVDFVKISSGERIKSISIVSADGRIVDGSYANSSQIEMNLTDLSPGGYYMVIRFIGGEVDIFSLVKL